jgi:excisionase family DNA binding protein
VKENNKDYLKSKDVARILDCSPDEVLELARRGELRAFKEGRFWKYREAAVMAYKRLNSGQG